MIRRISTRWHRKGRSIVDNCRTKHLCIVQPEQYAMQEKTVQGRGVPEIEVDAACCSLLAIGHRGPSVLDCPAGGETHAMPNMKFSAGCSKRGPLSPGHAGSRWKSNLVSTSILQSGSSPPTNIIFMFGALKASDRIRRGYTHYNQQVLSPILV